MEKGYAPFLVIAYFRSQRSCYHLFTQLNLIFIADSPTINGICFSFLQAKTIIENNVSLKSHLYPSDYYSSGLKLIPPANFSYF